MVLAQLAVLETRGNPKTRLQAKTNLTRMLYEKGLGKKDIVQLHAFLDWVITLPRDLKIQYNEAIKQLEGEKKCDTSLHRNGLAEWRD